jgi:hypothetical protein
MAHNYPQGYDNGNQAGNVSTLQYLTRNRFICTDFSGSIIYRLPKVRMMKQNTL